MILRARLVLPLSAPPIRDGAVLISGQRIAAVGRWRDLRSHPRQKAVDLGDSVLMPGLVNAHCHLDYTAMAGQFPPVKVFTDWIKLINTAKAQWSRADYADSWLRGAKMLVRAGVTTVADIEAVPELLPEMWNAAPLRILSFLEMIGFTARRAPALIVEETSARISSLPASRCRAGLSPHAPYSTSAGLLRLSALTARRRRLRLCIHVAESAAEFEMFTRAQGGMFDWLRRSSRDMSDCGLGSPVRHLAGCGALGDNLLAVHVNYLATGDAALLANSRASVVHCPRSHAYFRHAPFPLRRLARAGVNVCLGTDSLASVNQERRKTLELNLFEEMRTFAAANPSLSAKTLVRMATLNGARALGLAGRIGQLSTRAFADLIALPFAGKVTGVYQAILHHAGEVRASMIDGAWAVPPPEG